MNGTISNNSDERGLLPYPVILAATKGDPDAMKLVLQHYRGYIAHLSMQKICAMRAFPRGRLSQVAFSPRRRSRSSWHF